MSIIKNLISKLTCNRNSFSLLEKIILDSVRKQLDAENAMLWDKQIESINKIQRLPQGVEVDFYRMKKGKPTYDPEMAFKNKPEEWLMADVSIQIQGSEPTLQCQIWLVNGNLFSIEYKGGINYFEEALSDENIKLSIDVNLKLKH